MKKIFGLLLLLPLFVTAQKVITHTVGPKESLSSIGRLYNINGRELANYNKIDYEKGLSIGQVLKIPVTNAKNTEAPAPPPVKEPAPAQTAPVSNEKGAPVYHVVGKKETLYHISTLYNKVPIADIKKWNHLTSDALSEGAKLIVGYNGAQQASPVTTPKVEKAPPPVEVKEPVVAEVPVAEKKPVEIKKETPKTEPVKTVPVAAKAGNFNGGSFRAVYESQTSGRTIAAESGTGGIFKSTSGWEDGKYYCLHNSIPAGTVIKITNNANGRSVYAKVLDLIPDIKQNNGLIIRISNAAADVLGAGDNKLDCTLNYTK